MSTTEEIRDAIQQLERQIAEDRLAVTRIVADQSSSSRERAREQTEAATEAAAANDATFAAITTRTESTAEGVRQIAEHITANPIDRTPPVGGGGAPPPSVRPPSHAPDPPHGAWVNEPGPDQIEVDPNIFRLPARPTKDLSYHDIMKSESSALAVLGKTLAYNRKFSEAYNNDTFLHAISTNFKREATDFETADDMYRDNNALSIRRRIESIAWHLGSSSNETYRHLLPGSGYFVLETDPITLKEQTVEVTPLSWAGFQARCVDPEKWLDASRPGAEMTADDGTRRRAPSKLDVAYGSTTAAQLATYARLSLVHPANAIFDESMLNGKPSAINTFESVRKFLQEKKLTVSALELKPVQPQYRDLGVRYDATTESWVQNNPLYNRHLIAGHAELEVTGLAMGKMYDVFVRQRYTGRQELDVLPELVEIIETRTIIPNLYRKMRDAVRRSMPDTDEDKLRTLRLQYRAILNRFRPEKHRFRFLIVAMLDLNTEIYKYADKHAVFPEARIISDVMDIAVQVYPDAPAHVTSGYINSLKELAEAYERRDTSWAESKANTEFFGLFTSLRRLLQWCVRMESKHATSVSQYPDELDPSMSSSHLFGDTPPPGQLMLTWTGDGSTSLVPQTEAGASNASSAAHYSAAHAAMQREQMLNTVAHKLLVNATDDDRSTSPLGSDDDDDKPEAFFAGNWKRGAPAVPRTKQQQTYWNDERDRELARGGSERDRDRRGNPPARNRGREPRRDGREPPPRKDGRTNDIKRSLVDQLQRVRQSPRGTGGQGANRRSEHPNSVRVDSMNQSTRQERIPYHTWKGLQRIEHVANSALQRPTKSTALLEEDLRTIVNAVKAARSSNAQSSNGPSTPRPAAHVTFDDESPTEHIDASYQAYLSTVNNQADDTINPPPASHSELSSTMPGPADVAYTNLLTQFPGIQDWDADAQSNAVHLMIDHLPAKALGLSLLGAENTRTTPAVQPSSRLDRSSSPSLTQSLVTTDDISPENRSPEPDTTTYYEFLDDLEREATRQSTDETDSKPASLLMTGGNAHDGSFLPRPRPLASSRPPRPPPPMHNQTVATIESTDTDIVLRIAPNDRRSSYYDGCASGCFEPSIDDCIPGISVAPPSGASIATAGHELKPSAICLKRNNHVVDVPGIGLAIITKLVSPAILPKAVNIKSITGGPVYKRLNVGMIQGAGGDSPDYLWFGTSECGRPVLSKPLMHQSNGLPVMELITDRAAEALVERGIPRFHSHSWPVPLPYDDVEALQLLVQATRDHQIMLTEQSLPTPEGFYPDQVYQCFAMYTNTLDDYGSNLLNTILSPDIDDSGVTRSELDAAPHEIIAPPPLLQSLALQPGPRDMTTASESAALIKPDIRGYFQREVTIGLVCAGIASTLFKQLWLQLERHAPTDVLGRALDIRVKVFCEINKDQREFAAQHLSSDAIMVTDLKRLVHDFRDGSAKPSDYHCDYYFFTPPCLGNTPLRAHIGYQPPPEAEIFLLCVEFAFWVQSRRAVWEMTPSHDNEYENHDEAVVLMEEFKLHPKAFSRVSSCYAGDGTHRDRFIVFTSDTPVPDFDVMDYLVYEPRPLYEFLVPLDAVEPHFWLDNSRRSVEFADYARAGGNETCRNDTRFASKYDVGRYKSRSRVAAYIEGSRDKEDKVYDSHYPAPTFTSFHTRIIDWRRHANGFPLEQCIRCMLLEEQIAASQFFNEQKQFLLSIEHDRAAKMIAGAVPGGLTDALLCCMINEDIKFQRQRTEPSFAEVNSMDSMLYDMNDMIFGTIAGEALLLATNEHDHSEKPLLDPSLLNTCDFSKLDDIEEPSSELFLTLDITPQQHAQLLRTMLAESDPSDRRPPVELSPSLVVRAHGDRLNQSRTDWPRKLEQGEPGYDEAFSRANIFHRTHYVAGSMMEKMIALHRPTGLKPGDSRYVRISDEYLQKRDSIPRHHITPGASTERLPSDVKPGQHMMLDGGDATVRSVFGLHRYFLVFICVKSAKKIIFYMQNNNARSFCEAVLYVRRLVKTELGTDLSGLYGDYFSTHRDQNVFGTLREELGIRMEVAPGYMHHLNPYVEGFIRLIKAEVRPRLKALIGQRINDEIVKDASKWWNLAMEHARQHTDIRPSHTLERDMSIIACPQAVWLGDLSFQADFSRLHPFGAPCHVLLEKSQHHWAASTFERAHFMINGQFNPIVHPGTTSPQSHVVLRDHNRLQVTGKVVFTYKEQMDKHTSSIITPTPTNPTASTGEPPEIPFAPLNAPNNVTAIEKRIAETDDEPAWGRSARPPSSSLNDSNSPGESPHRNLPLQSPLAPENAVASPTRTSDTAVAPTLPSPIPPAPTSPVPAAPPSPSRPTHSIDDDPAFDSTDSRINKSGDIQPSRVPVSPARPATPSPNDPAESIVEPTATLRRSTRANFGQRTTDPGTTYEGGGLASPASRQAERPRVPVSQRQEYVAKLSASHLPVSAHHTHPSMLCNVFAIRDCMPVSGGAPSALPAPSLLSTRSREADKQAEPADDDVDRMVEAFAREFELGSMEYDQIRGHLHTMIDRPRGQHSRDQNYGQNTDVHESILYALMDQLMFTGSSIDEVCLQIDYNDNTEYRNLKLNGAALLSNHRPSTDRTAEPEVESSSKRAHTDPKDRSLRVSLEEHKLLDLVGVSEEDKPRMIAAIAKEINDLVATGCFTIVEMPYDRKAIHSRIVLKVKYKADGSYDRHKARLVAKGFMEKLGSDFFSTYSPMASLTTARALMAIAVHYSLNIFHSDIPQAFIQATLENDAWLRLPPGVKLIDDKGDVHAIVKLVRSLYGLRAAPQHFNKVLVSFMQRQGFKQCAADTCLFSMKTGNGWALVASEVDDLLIVGTDQVAVDHFKAGLIEEFKITDYAPVRSFLGINIEYSPEEGELTMDVTYKIDHLFEKHTMLAGHLKGKGDVAFDEAHANIPDDKELTSPLDRYILQYYASLNGVLIYMGITCRPDLTYALSKTSKGMHTPKPKHVAMLRHLLNYLYKSKMVCLVFSRDNPPMYALLKEISRSDAALSFVATSDGQHVQRLTGFADANYANLTDEERKSNTGFIFFMFGCAISWRSKLQPITATSTHEAELVACATAAAEAVWCRKLLIDIGFAFDLTPVTWRDDSTKRRLELDGEFVSDEAYVADPLWIFNDNLGTTQTINRPDSSSPGIKHIDTRYFRIRQWVQKKALRVAYVGTDYNVADFFTKGLHWPKFSKFRDRIGLRHRA